MSGIRVISSPSLSGHSRTDTEDIRLLFLYTVQLNPIVWNMLIPVVALERLAIACLIYVLYKLFGFVKTRVLNKTLHFVSHYGKIFGA